MDDDRGGPSRTKMFLWIWGNPESRFCESYAQMLIVHSGWFFCTIEKNHCFYVAGLQFQIHPFVD